MYIYWFADFFFHLRASLACLLQIAGGGLLAMGVYNLSTGDQELEGKNIDVLGNWTSYALTCLGGLTSVISLIACCAANHSPTAATIFFSFMQMIFATLLITGTYAYVQLPHAHVRRRMT